MGHISCMKIRWQSKFFQPSIDNTGRITIKVTFGALFRPHPIKNVNAGATDF